MPRFNRSTVRKTKLRPVTRMNDPREPQPRTPINDPREPRLVMKTSMAGGKSRKSRKSRKYRKSRKSRKSRK